MIVGTKETLKTYKGLNERIDAAIDFILNLDPNIEPGRHEIDGDNVFANVQNLETSSLEKISFEAHRKYLDLQYIIKGSEIMVYAPLADCTPKMEFDEENDYVLLSGEGSQITINEGGFYLVHPFDAHAPGKGYEKKPLKKVVVKIKA